MNKNQSTMVVVVIAIIIIGMLVYVAFKSNNAKEQTEEIIVEDINAVEDIDLDNKNSEEIVINEMVEVEQSKQSSPETGPGAISVALAVIIASVIAYRTHQTLR